MEPPALIFSCLSSAWSAVLYISNVHDILAEVLKYRCLLARVLSPNLGSLVGDTLNNPLTFPKDSPLREVEAVW